MRFPIEDLFLQLRQNVALAKCLDFPECDLTIKTPIIGFSMNSPRESWDSDHRDFVRDRLEDEYTTDDLKDFGDEVNAIRLFVGMCLGYLLGSRQAGMLTDTEFGVADAQIPGFVFLKSGRFGSL
jgi:hypothetical protein